jgi:hypothetical protein
VRTSDIPYSSSERSSTKALTKVSVKDFFLPSKTFLKRYVFPVPGPATTTFFLDLESSTRLCHAHLGLFGTEFLSPAVLAFLRLCLGRTERIYTHSGLRHAFILVQDFVVSMTESSIMSREGNRKKRASQICLALLVEGLCHFHQRFRCFLLVSQAHMDCVARNAALWILFVFSVDLKPSNHGKR